MKKWVALLLILALLAIAAVVGLTAKGKEDGFAGRIIRNFLEGRGILKEDAEAREAVVEFLAAAQNGDMEAMKALFAAEAISEVGEATMEEMLKNFVQYFQGDFVTVEALFGAATEENSYDGKKSKQICAPFDVATEKNQYRLAIKYIPYDEWNPDNAGIWSIYIIERAKDTNLEQPYRGDLKYQTGIFFDVARLR